MLAEGCKVSMKHVFTCSNLGTRYPVYHKTQHTCDKAVGSRHTLAFVPDNFDTQDTCEKAVHIKPYPLEFVSNHLKNQEMYNEARRIKPSSLFLILDYFETHKICI